MIGSSAKRLRNSDISVHERTPSMRVCNAGNAKCCLKTGKGILSKSMDCDICCVAAGFCHECSCILCGKCNDHDLDEYYFIQYQETLSDEFICGHNQMIEENDVNVSAEDKNASVMISITDGVVEHHILASLRDEVDDFSQIRTLTELYEIFPLALEELACLETPRIGKSLEAYGRGDSLLYSGERVDQIGSRGAWMNIKHCVIHKNQMLMIE
ncbi:hypothetical protein SUGI_0469160 [Cryptomeria japonica]|nr:hypothetical protein SUGI_0469160 [Cryptomeria japonica]